MESWEVSKGVIPSSARGVNGPNHLAFTTASHHLPGDNNPDQPHSGESCSFCALSLLNNQGICGKKWVIIEIHGECNITKA